MNLPFFTIVIPTYGRPKLLAACLQSLTRLDYPQDCFEVIVVDDGSEVLQHDIVYPFHSHLNLVFLERPHAGPASARNYGAAEAKGRYLAFIDDDCTPAHNWLQALSTRFSDSPDCAIVGRTLNALEKNPYSSASQMLVDYFYRCFNSDPSNAQFLTSNNLAFPSRRFHSIGGFDTSFRLAGAEDRDICDRWLHHGYKIIYVPEALVYHANALTCFSFWKQHFNYGRGAFSFHRRRAQRRRGVIGAESPGFYFNLLFDNSSGAKCGSAVLLALLRAVSQIANTAGFCWEAVQKRWETRNGLNRRL